MARPSATAALLLVLSLLAVARCRTVAVTADLVADEPESTVAVDLSDYNDLSPNPTTLPTKAAEASATEEEEALPAEQHHGFEFLRLPSYNPCRLRRHPSWKPHHRRYYRDPACSRLHDHDHDSDHDGERREGVSHLAMILPAEEARETEEVKPVAEPDPDRSLPDSDDGVGEPVASREPWSFADADGHDVEPWKKEMLRRWLRYVYFHPCFHHGMLGHRLHHVHHGQEEEDEEKNMVRKQRLHHAEHGGGDSDDEDEEVEEMVRLFRKAFMRIRRRRRFGYDDAEAEHGRRFFHHLHHHDNRHHHAEEAETKQAGDGEEQSGVMAWIKGLMNRF